MIIETDANTTKSSALNDSRGAPLTTPCCHFLTYKGEQRRYTHINAHHSNTTSNCFVKRYMFRSKTTTMKRALQNNPH